MDKNQKDYEKKLISVKEFSENYNVGLNKAYEMVNIPGFPCIRIGKRILVVSSKIDEFIYSKIGERF